MMNWYVLFTLTGKEEELVDRISKTFDLDAAKPFVPKRENLFKRRGCVYKSVEILFPGYVFVASEIKNIDFAITTRKILEQVNRKFRLLGDKNDHYYIVSNRDKELLGELMDNNYCIPSSSGIIENERVIITEGPMRGKESIIKKIERHKRQAVIELSFMGCIRQITVAMDIIQKIKT